MWYQTFLHSLETKFFILPGQIPLYKIKSPYMNRLHLVPRLEGSLLDTLWSDADLQLFETELKELLEHRLYHGVL